MFPTPPPSRVGQSVLSPDTASIIYSLLPLPEEEEEEEEELPSPSLRLHYDYMDIVPSLLLVGGKGDQSYYSLPRTNFGHF